MINKTEKRSWKQNEMQEKYRRKILMFYERYNIHPMSFLYDQLLFVSYSVALCSSQCVEILLMLTFLKFNRNLSKYYAVNKFLCFVLQKNSWKAQNQCTICFTLKSAFGDVWVFSFAQALRHKIFFCNLLGRVRKERPFNFLRGLINTLFWQSVLLHI